MLHAVSEVRDKIVTGAHLLLAGSEHALSQLDSTGEHGHFAWRWKRDPPVKIGIGIKRAGQGGAHRLFPVRMTAAAFSTARMMRLCEPQRQMFASSASAISARDGFGFLSRSALAEIRIPARQ